MLVSGSENITINLGSPLRLGHRNGTRIAEFDAHLKLLYGKYQLAIGNLAKLLGIEILNPVNCMKGVMDKLGIPRKYEAEAVDLFVSQYGEGPCTAHEIYFGISEILYMLACEGEEGSRITRMEETVARALSVNWTEYDVPGVYKWKGEEFMEYSIQLNAVNNPEKSVRAFATVVFGDSFKVTNVAVLEGSKGNFVSMPSFRSKERDEHNNPVYKDVCNPITKEFREELYGDILRLYDEMEQTGKAEVRMEADEPDEPEFTVRVTPFEREGSNMVGLANIVLNDSFAVGNVSVVQGRNGMFVAMPSYKAGNKYRDVCFPITKEFREKVNNAVLETYQQAKEQAMQEGQERASQQMQNDDRGFMKVSGEPLPFR